MTLGTGELVEGIINDIGQAGAGQMVNCDLDAGNGVGWDAKVKAALDPEFNSPDGYGN